jgi:hypothetical protein
MEVRAQREGRRELRAQVRLVQPVEQVERAVLVVLDMPAVSLLLAPLEI